MIRNLYKTKTEAIFWGCMAIVLLVITFIHPRIIYPVLIVFCLMSALVSFFKKKQKDAVRMRRDIVGNILGIAIICYVGQFLNIFFPLRAAYEYKKNMAAFKAEWPERFDHFPETIPEGAKGAKWMVRPSFLQGSGYYKLSFYITDDYINRIYDKYAGGDTVYSWNSEMIWVNEVSGSSIHFFLDDYIDESQKKNIELIVLYDNNDINHHHDEGICINRKEGYICYWTE